MRTIHRYLILIAICVTFSLAVTFATYFYSHSKWDGGWGVTIYVYRGWPSPWAIESNGFSKYQLDSAFYPFDFQAPNFSLDLVFWATVLLLPSFLYLYRKNSQEQRRMLNH